MMISGTTLQNDKYAMMGVNFVSNRTWRKNAVDVIDLCYTIQRSICYVFFFFSYRTQ